MKIEDYGTTNSRCGQPAKDIPVFYRNEIIAQVYANIIGGIEIQVSDEDAEKARNWLIENGYSSCLT